MKFEFLTTQATNGTLVLGVFNDSKLSPAADAYDKANGGFITKYLKTSSHEGKKGSLATLSAPTNSDYNAVVLLGMGDVKKLDRKELEGLGAKVSSLFLKTKEEKLHFAIDGLNKLKGITEAEASAYLLSGFYLRSFQFNKYKTKKKTICALKSVSALTPDMKASSTLFDELNAVAEGVFLTREVVSEAPNVLYPETMAQKALELAKLGVKVEVFGEKEMKKLGMNALLGVGQGSEKESKLIVCQWNGGDKKQAPVAFVGKGVTFDTGGISLKPSANMDEMKYDMGGSGVVIGLMKALAKRKAKVNVVGIMGMAENMPSGNAQRPGDIVTSMSGQTIEILNTDAEGRLVLADALWYTQERFKPQQIIDLATLTGAVVVALGHEYAGLFSNNHDIAAKLMRAGDEVGELVWRMPLHDGYDKDIDSTVADVKNIGSGRGAGSATAAHFLQRFVNDTPWAHLDIAGVSWEKTNRGLSGKGATAFGVRLLNHYVKENFETK